MTGTFSYEHVVTFEDTNVVGNVYFVNHLRWQGRCRELFLAEHAPGVVAAVETGELTLVTLSCGCDYFGELRSLDRVRIEMSLAALRGNRIDLRFRYLRLGPGPAPAELVARGQHATACMRRQDGRLEPVSVPEELALAIHAISDPPGS
jgi:enediyne biosynthesis thioesterase